MKLPVLLLACLLLGSCSDLKEKLGIDQPKAEKVTVPPDEATATERETITQTLQKISDLAAALGVSKKFDSIPVIVTTENPLKTNRVGYCQWDGDGNGVYIAINRSLFLTDPYMKLDWVFATLLHEIGHCYFHRQHNTDAVSKPGYKIYVTVSDTFGGTVHDGRIFPVSMMYSDGYGGGTKFNAIPNFQRYYVAEMLGLDRVQSVDELPQRFTGIEVIPAGPND